MGTRSDEIVPEYQRVQRQFASYIRDPDSITVPAGVEQRRMDIYKRLFFNNIASFCTRSFKSFRQFVDDTEWHALIRDFMREHACTSPYFKDIPLAFVDFLASCDQLREKYPFILEMCHLDAVKMQLRLAPDPPVSLDLAVTDQSAVFLLSTTVRLLSYEWPVHTLTPSSWNDGIEVAQPNWLIVFRDRSDHVDILVTNVHTFRMLEVMNEPIALSSLTVQLDTEFNITETVLHEKLLPTIQALRKRGIILTVQLN